MIPHFNDQNNINIVFSPNDKYVKYFSVALQSLISHANTNYFYNIIIFEKDISDRNKNILKDMLPTNFNINFIDVSKSIKQYLPKVNLYSKKYWSESMFYRILIPAILQDFDKVLYLDSDICINSDLVELFNIDFENNSLLAVQDSIIPIISEDQKRLKHITTSLNIKNVSYYFNSGVLLFNNQKINQNLNNYLEKLTFGLLNKKLIFPDQDLLNLVFENEVKYISGKWNCMYDSWFFNKESYKKCLSPTDYNTWLANKKHACIIHYTSLEKPWMNPDADTAEIFWHYARKSPFYEEILFSNVYDKTIKYLTNKRKNQIKYFKYQILKHVTFGKTKTNYEKKANRLKIQLDKSKN